MEEKEKVYTTPRRGYIHDGNPHGRRSNDEKDQRGNSFIVVLSNKKTNKIIALFVVDILFEPLIGQRKQLYLGNNDLSQWNIRFKHPTFMNVSCFPDILCCRIVRKTYNERMRGIDGGCWLFHHFPVNGIWM